MLGCIRYGWIIVVSLAMTASLRAQSFFPLPVTLPKTELTPKQTKQRDSLYKFALGLVCVREDRLIEGLKALEDAAALDPEVPAVQRELVSVYMSLERLHDAITAADKVVRLDPEDFDGWFVCARLHKNVGQTKEYRWALEKGLGNPRLKEERPEVAQQMYLDLGGLLELEEDIPAAVKALTEAVKILNHPDLIMERGPYNKDQILARASDTYERIGALNRKQKKYVEAIEAYQSAQMRAKEGAGRLSYNLAQIAKEQGNFPQSLVYVDQYLKTIPLGVEAHEFRIDLLNKLKREAEILPWLEKIALVDVHNIPLRHLLARTCFQQGKKTEAERIYNKLAADAPSDDVYRGLFEIYQTKPSGVPELFTILQRTIDLARKRPVQPGAALAGDQAQAMINVLRLNGQLSTALVKHAFASAQKNERISFDTLRLLAALADKHRQFAESERFYLDLLKDPGQRTEPAVYGGYLRTLWRNRKYAEIVKLCDECLKNDALVTNRLLFTSDKARALAALEKIDDALATADEAIKSAQDDNLIYAHQLRVRILTQAEKYDLAEKECKAMFKKFTSLEAEQDIRYLLSGVYNAAKKKKESEDQLLEILKADPNNASANNDLGYLWADQNKNLKEAEAMIRKALEVERGQRKVFGAEQGEDNAAYIDSLGWVLFRKGDIDGARKELEKAVSLPDGDDPVLWDHLGDVYFRLKLPALAQTAWEKSKQIYELDRRRKMDDRYRELQEKILLVRNPGKVVPMGN